MSITLNKNSTLDTYHDNEQGNNNKIVNNLIGMAWVGIAIIIVGIILVCTKGIDMGIITTSAGAIVEITSGIILVLAKYEINSKDKYFETLSSSEERKQLVEFIKSIEDLETRCKCQSMYVEKYTEILMQ